MTDHSIPSAAWQSPPAPRAQTRAPEQPAATPANAATSNDIEAVYRDADAWLNEWLLPTVLVRDAQNSRASGVYWCPWWFMHPEVVARIDGLWRAWEFARADSGDAPLNWWRDHFDIHWPRLTASAGPMGRCNAERHEPGERLRTARNAQYRLDDVVGGFDPAAWQGPART